MGVRSTGLVSGLDTESIVKELMAAQRTKQTKIENKKTKLEWTQDKWKELNTKIYKLYTDSVSKMRLQGSYSAMKATSSNEDIATATATSLSASGSHTLEVTQLASSQFVTGNKISGMTSSTKLATKGIAAGTVITITSGTGTDETTNTIKIDSNTTVNDFVKKVKDAGINAMFDSTQERIFLSSKESGVSNQFKITSSNGNLTGIGLTQIDDAFFNIAPEADGTIKKDNVVLVKAMDANIKLDGATLTGESNSFTAAGITFNLLNKTSTEKVTLTVSNDTKASYDMIKGFIKDYNALLDEMNDIYYADSARGYEPLTDDEKEAMTDDQVEKWEKKIKDSLLRRDNTLGNLIETMKTSLASTVKIDNKDYSFATYGIYTSKDYTEKGLLHIYGNSEDSTYSNEEDKLKAALEENPEQVAEVFSGIAKKLYDNMTEKMKSSSLNSALTYYNDKQITKQLASYKTEISDWDDRLQDLEERYYKQFSDMETALNKLNSQSTALSGLLGISTQ